ncbi:adenosine deaminase [Quadrisphaera granulorum]|uniref:Adenine deaminase n=1 Tax=Quadrisphaera granulorum TaxID=317664 RepID=A0A316AF66_9ACTN|nr:adenosine deaminase [Quadrisphaera granulorum]PWJ56241.1 adenosine deaminase [Quadrisphaera granulorum]SZE94875.1 adenosine deaminase [Quadrisphaera granulorum]
MAPAPQLVPSLAALVTDLPACELHVHLEGTLEPELLLGLAARNGIELPTTTVEEVRATHVFDSLASFLAVYYPAMEVLQTRRDFFDLATAYLTRAAAQNVRRAEMFFDPQAHTSRGVPFEVVVEGLLDAVERAPGELGIDAELILCFLRDHPVASAEETLTAALPYAGRILGVGLDSDERDHPPADFAAVFARARAAGFKLTMHCDIDQQGTLEHLRQVIEDIAVDRIDHGSNIVDAPDLLAVAVQRGLGFTACPLSNGFVTEQMKAPEIVTLLRAGAKVCVNGDDPAYFGGYLKENLAALAAAADLSAADVVQLARNSFEASWAPSERIAEYLAEVDAVAASHGVGSGVSR